MQAVENWSVSSAAITLLSGFVIFAPCWVKLRSMRDYEVQWKNWLNMSGIIVGFCMMAIGALHL